MKRKQRFFLIRKILPLLLLITVDILIITAINYGENQLANCGCPTFDSKTNGDFDPTEKTAYFLNQPVTPPLSILPVSEEMSVLGEESADQKWIEVDLSEQKLIAWEGDKKFLESLVSSGKWGRTPTGEFSIWGKFKYTKMSGGSKEKNTYYYLPNVPYTMYFYRDFGLHGTYWHNNFGQPMSHGCVNLPTLVAEKLFYWTTPTLPLGRNSVVADKNNPGTKVVIHE